MAKKYYWLRLHRDFFKRHDVRIIEEMPNGKDYLLFLLKLMAESIDHEGRLRFNAAIPYNDSMLSTITSTNIDVVRSALKVFSELGLMTILDDRTLYMSIVEDMIGSRTDSADRMQLHRARKRELGASLVTNSDVTSISLSSSSSHKKKESKKAQHPTLGVPMNQTRYDNLCKDYGQAVVDDYMERVTDWANGKSKRVADYASTAANWLKRDSVQKKPKVSVSPDLKPPTCKCGGHVKAVDGEALCVDCHAEWEWRDERWVSV